MGYPSSNLSLAHLNASKSLVDQLSQAPWVLLLPSHPDLLSSVAA